MSQKLLIIIFAFLLTGMLFYQGFSPAHDTAVVVSGSETFGNEIRRGEIIDTNESRLLLQINNTILALDERTTVEFVAMADEEIVLRFTRGRIYAHRPDAKNPLRVVTNYHESIMNSGIASFVNYDFREIVSVIPIEGEVNVYTELDDKIETIGSPVDIHETEPVERTEFEFNKNSTSAVEFYSWVDKEIKQLF
jgi:hypothetical protein